MTSLPESAVRRGNELRCPACLRFKPAWGTCPVCGCGEVPLERHGAARMLLLAGVDRFALAGRVATLDSRQAESLERQYAVQWEMVWPLLEDVRRCEAHLIQQGFVEEMVELLAQRLPADPLLLAREVGPPERPETLEELFSKSPSWLVERLAAIALMHQGRLSGNVMTAVYSALLDEGAERTQLEAMIALTRWRVWRWVRIGADGWKRVRELARKFLGHPELAARAAVAWVRASRGEDPEVDVLFALNQGLSHPDPEVRFECALCLDSEQGLTEALDSADPAIVSEARKALASRGSRALFERLASEGGAAFASDVVGKLPMEVPPRRWRRCSPSRSGDRTGSRRRSWSCSADGPSPSGPRRRKRAGVTGPVPCSTSCRVRPRCASSTGRESRRCPRTRCGPSWKARPRRSRESPRAGGRATSRTCTSRASSRWRAPRRSRC